MSRSNPTISIKSPVTKYLERKNGAFSYWDKSLEQRVAVTPPISFCFLDATAMVDGYNKPRKSGIRSNEITWGNEPVKVVYNSTGEVIAEGLYKEIKEKVKAAGGRYTKVVYGSDSNLETVQIKFSGAALMAWGDFEKKTGRANLEAAGAMVVITAMVEKDPGDPATAVPVFEMQKCTAEMDEAADAADRELQEYFAARASKTSASTPQQEPQQEDPEGEESDIPF